MPTAYDNQAAYEDNSPAAQTKATAKGRGPVMTQQSVSRSRVPDFIKQSMVSESIDTTALSDNPLDRMNLDRLRVKPQQQVTEQMVSSPVGAQVHSQAVGIDYTIIKAIINECIDSKLKEYGLNKQTLNENTLKTIHLKGGVIKLVDNSGNVYSAQLEKKGNINDNKK